MRLKFLFFPIMLSVSVVIFISFVWPEINNIKQINEDIIAKKEELRVVNDKNAAIELLGKELVDNADVQNVVKRYLPNNKTEERIISEINFLANDANVSLLEISLKSGEKPNAPVVKNISPSDSQEGLNEVNLLQTIPVEISIAGEYEKIRIFLNNLQRMPVFNVVKSVKIAKQENEGTDEQTTEGEPVVNNSNLLLADVEINFGYLNAVKINNQKVEKFNAILDNETIVALKKYIPQKAQLIGEYTVPEGKQNPFVVN
ncbi:MAG: hypothetical protein PHP62_00800 [Candidatus Moranbacteria bacterium]|nr:hypothetical protein [Candidatus Moranbacteria bacterium]